MENKKVMEINLEEEEEEEEEKKKSRVVAETLFQEQLSSLLASYRDLFLELFSQIWFLTKECGHVEQGNYDVTMLSDNVFFSFVHAECQRRIMNDKLKKYEVFDTLNMMTRTSKKNVASWLKDESREESEIFGIVNTTTIVNAIVVRTSEERDKLRKEESKKKESERRRIVSEVEIGGYHWVYLKLIRHNKNRYSFLIFDPLSEKIEVERLKNDFFQYLKEIYNTDIEAMTECFLIKTQIQMDVRTCGYLSMYLLVMDTEALLYDRQELKTKHKLVLLGSVDSTQAYNWIGKELVKRYQENIIFFFQSEPHYQVYSPMKNTINDLLGIIVTIYKTDSTIKTEIDSSLANKETTYGEFLIVFKRAFRFEFQKSNHFEIMSREIENNLKTEEKKKEEKQIAIQPPLIQQQQPLLVPKQKKLPFWDEKMNNLLKEFTDPSPESLYKIIKKDKEWKVVFNMNLFEFGGCFKISTKDSNLFEINFEKFIDLIWNSKKKFISIAFPPKITPQEEKQIYITKDDEYEGKNYHLMKHMDLILKQFKLLMFLFLDYQQFLREKNLKSTIENTKLKFLKNANTHDVFLTLMSDLASIKPSAPKQLSTHPEEVSKETIYRIEYPTMFLFIFSIYQLYEHYRLILKNKFDQEEKNKTVQILIFPNEWSSQPEMKRTYWQTLEKESNEFTLFVMNVIPNFIMEELKKEEKEKEKEKEKKKEEEKEKEKIITKFQSVLVPEEEGEGELVEESSFNIKEESLVRKMTSPVGMPVFRPALARQKFTNTAGIAVEKTKRYQENIIVKPIRKLDPTLDQSLKKNEEQQSNEFNKNEEQLRESISSTSSQEGNLNRRTMMSPEIKRKKGLFTPVKTRQ
jgi:hypothetical protein